MSIESAKVYIARGWAVVPLPSRQKGPRIRAWQKSVFTPADFTQNDNIGVKLGAPSGGLIDVDLDHPVARDLVREFLPSTGRAFGRDSNPLSHWLYICDDPGRTRQWKSATGKTIVELRSTGTQTMFPPSVHPTGELVRWATEGEPARVTWEEMETACDALAVAVRQRIGDPPPASPSQQARTVPPRALGPSASRERLYAEAAMQDELAEVRTAGEGSRNSTLNQAAFALGQFVAGGLLGEEEVRLALAQAANETGLSDREITATIRSGLEGGKKEPRRVLTARFAPTGPSVADSPAVGIDLPSFPPNRYTLDLYGNVDRFITVYGPDVLWCQSRGVWYVWNGQIWQVDDARAVELMAARVMRGLLREASTSNGDACMKWAMRCNMTATPRKEMLDGVKPHRPTSVEKFDKSPMLIGVQNGVVDLRTGGLLPYAREQLISLMCPMVYDPTATCPQWEKFLGEIMGENADMVLALQRMTGYFLTGDISVQIFPILYGPGGNGKNVFLDTILGIMGPYAAEAPEGLVTARQNDEHPTEIAMLAGKRLVVASETEEGKKMRIGLVKKITGNKYLTGRFMRQDYFQFERTHKAVLVTNNKPVITESNNAIWRRLRLIPFTVIIPKEKQDPKLTEKLGKEWPGIFAWAVAGATAWWQNQGELALPEIVTAATEEYRDDSDLIGEFITEKCTDWRGQPAQKMRTPKEKVYSAYCDWCRDCGVDAISRTAFGARMREKGFSDIAAWVANRTQKCWSDITLLYDKTEV